METQQIAQQSMFAYLRQLIEARRAKPENDLATFFALAANEDGSLPETEMCWWAWAIFTTGFETSSNVMSQGVLALIERSGEMTLADARRPERELTSV